jgi:hypothetical protein
MQITRIPQLIELQFWLTVIPWMENSARLRALLKRAYRYHYRLTHLPHAVVATGWALSGLGLGFALGLLATVLH